MSEDGSASKGYMEAAEQNKCSENVPEPKNNCNIEIPNIVKVEPSFESDGNSETEFSCDSGKLSCRDNIEEDVSDIIVKEDSEASIIVEKDLRGSEPLVDEKSGSDYVESDGDVLSELDSVKDSDNNTNCGFAGLFDTVFIDDDGAEYIMISSQSMTREYILLDEYEDEIWFLREKVANEVKTFLARDHIIKGKTDCEERKFRLNEIIKQIK